MKRDGVPIVVSAASGTGKTSLCRRLLETLSHVERSVSFTTRAPRGVEVNGVDYHFVDDEQFDRMIADGELLEWAAVFGKRYGTSERAVRDQLAAGVDVFLDIDVQGGLQIRDRFPDAILIFLLPPSMDELRRRLSNRGTESMDAVQRRLSEARREITHAQAYDFLVINDDFDKAAADLRAVIISARLRVARNGAAIAELLDEGSVRA